MHKTAVTSEWRISASWAKQKRKQAFPSITTHSNENLLWLLAVTGNFLFPASFKTPTRPESWYRFHVTDGQDLFREASLKAHSAGMEENEKVK